MSKDWPLWEVFIRSQHGLAHKHVGSLHAPDAEMAINHARDVYTRRNEGLSIWVVRASDISASSPGDKIPCSSRPTARSTGIPRSFRCLKKSSTCKAAGETWTRLSSNTCCAWATPR